MIRETGEREREQRKGGNRGENSQGKLLLIKIFVVLSKVVVALVPPVQKWKEKLREKPKAYPKCDASMVSQKPTNDNVESEFQK